MEPFRAFVADILPEKQRTRGFAMQSVFIGLGAVIASALPWMLANWFHVSNQASAGHSIPLTVRLSFYIGAGAFFGAILWTILTTKEYPPEDMEAFQRMKSQKHGILDNLREIKQAIKTMPATMKQLAPVQVLNLARPILHVALLRCGYRAQCLWCNRHRFAGLRNGSGMGRHLFWNVFAGLFLFFICAAVHRSETWSKKHTHSVFAMWCRRTPVCRTYP